MTQTFPIEALKTKATPYYYYNTQLLKETLAAMKDAMRGHDNYFMHYAIKANANPIVLKPIKEAGVGIDCVSGGEIEAALQAGFPADSIMFAGVGKADWEIDLALQAGIACFNVESEAELDVIAERCAALGKTRATAERNRI